MSYQPRPIPQPRVPPERPPAGWQTTGYREPAITPEEARLRRIEEELAVAHDVIRTLAADRRRAVAWAIVMTLALVWRIL